ncbi:hypothetical protein PG988_003525 [Apiospora saccharicola]
MAPPRDVLPPVTARRRRNVCTEIKKNDAKYNQPAMLNTLVETARKAVQEKWCQEDVLPPRNVGTDFYQWDIDRTMFQYAIRHRPFQYVRPEPNKQPYSVEWQAVYDEHQRVVPDPPPVVPKDRRIEPMPAPSDDPVDKAADDLKNTSLETEDAAPAAATEPPSRPIGSGSGAPFHHTIANASLLNFVPLQFLQNREQNQKIPATPSPSIANMAEQAEKERANDIAATAANLKVATAAAHKIVCDEYPAPKANDLQALVRPPTPDANWTAADLASSQAAWQADPMKDAFLDIRGNNNIAPCGATPFGSTESNGAVLVNGQPMMVNGETVRKPNWSATFAKPLLTVLAHEMWQDQPDAAAIALQYVIKCRNNDQRIMRWPKINPTTDSFLGQFRMRMSLSPGDVPLPEIHRQVDERLGKRGVWSKLFSEIEKLAYRPEPERAP